MAADEVRVLAQLLPMMHADSNLAGRPFALH
jgi:hypothetical protein